MCVSEILTKSLESFNKLNVVQAFATMIYELV